MVLAYNIEIACKMFGFAQIKYNIHYIEQSTWLERNRDMEKKDKQLLIELICKEQSRMIMRNSESYTTDHYRHLEDLKVRIKTGSSHRTNCPAIILR